MRLFEVGKKKEGYKCVQYGLFNDAEFDAESFINGFEKDWGVKLEAEIRNDDMITHVNFNIDKIQFVCSFMKAAYPDDSPIEAAKRNPFWREAEECVNNHKAFMIVSILENKCLNQIKTCSIFTQVCCSLMRMSDGICMYNADSDLIIEKNSYRSYMNIMKAAIENNDYYLPYQNWININYVREENGKIGAFTIGLNIFNKLEIELVHVEYEVEIMQKIVNKILLCLIMDNKTLESGELIKLYEDIEIITKKGKGYYLNDRETIRIFY
ncbi:hypothetical protein KQI86_08595 [Clostridium sp. MSJ-11]|uniref:DUF4261 domain-containing protein n=1 Tax=Clostridium mobile TaxID=2841512 RepID=A0ABS6EGP5_9CLOT|nr:hypothetical protein [Clostridium mobile]MBU5484384.1 hypothetical protein [Clostridium mobile]